VASITGFIKDSLVNLVSGLGTAQDKSIYNQFTLALMSEQQIRAAYRSDWVARKGVDLPAYDCTKRWRAWQASKPQIEKLENFERVLGVQRKVQAGLALGRLFGGGALVLGVDQGLPEEPLDVERLGSDSLKFINVVSRYDVSVRDVNRDVTSFEFGEPASYDVRGRTGMQVNVHASRVVRFIGRPLPDSREATEAEGWGDSVLMAVQDAIQNVAVTSGAVAALVNESKIDVVKIPRFMELVGTEQYRSLLTERFALAARTKSFVNTLILDKEEEWSRISANFAGLPDILKLYLLISCSAFDIPSTRFLGQSAVGLNATGEGDLRNYYDSLSSFQTTDLTPAISKLDDVLIRSALGSRDPSLYYNWNSLWELDEVQRADINLKKATTFKIDVDSNMVDAEVLRQARENQLVEDGVYPGLDIILEEEGTDDVDEGDDDTSATFAKTKADEPAMEGAVPEVPVQNAALNGAQITSLMEIVRAVTAEELPPEAATALIRIGFPDVDTGLIQTMISAAESFEPKEKPIPPALAAGAGVPPDADNVVPFPKKPAVAKAAEEAAIADAAPRTLYVYRKLLNAKAVLKHFEDQGMKNLEPAEEMHVTVMFTRTPVDWMKMGEPSYSMDPNGEMTVPAGGPRVVERLGPKGAVVLHFASMDLCCRHESMKHRGAEYDWPEYQPHVTVAYDLEFAGNVRPWQGPLEFGPETFEEVRDYAGGGTFEGDE
jgi:phage-related protein (TIGR01555 family)